VSHREAATREALVLRYDAGVGLVEAALAGITDSELDHTPADGGWTARMVVHHLADSETNSYVRLRRLLAEPPGVVLEGYDEAEWARELHYDRPIAVSLDVFRSVRASSSELLTTITDADLERTGVHTESGAYTLADWLRIYAEHGEDHARQIREARVF